MYQHSTQRRCEGTAAHQQSRKFCSVGWMLALLFAGDLHQLGWSHTLTDYLPAGAVASLECYNAKHVIELIETSGYLERIVEFKEFRRWQDSIDGRRLRGGLEILQGQLNMTWLEALKRVFGRQAILAFYPPPAGFSSPVMVVLLRVQDVPTAALLRQKAQPWLELDGNFKIHQEREVWYVSHQSQPWHVAVWQDWIVVCQAETHVRQILDAITRPELHEQPVLSESPAWQNLNYEQDELQTALIGCIDLKTIRQLLNQARSTPEKLDNPLASLVLGGLVEVAAHADYVHSQLRVEQSSFQLQTRLQLVPAIGETKVYHSLLLGIDKEETQRFAQLPRYLGSFEWVRDWAGWYQNRDRLLIARVLPEFDKFETGLATFLPGKDFAEDVLRHLAPRMSIVFARQNYEHLTRPPGIRLPAAALVFELRSEQAVGLFQLFFQTIASLSNLEAGKYGRAPWVLSSENHAGVQISFARYLEVPDEQTIPPVVYNFQPASAVVNQRFVMASSLGLCRDLIDLLRQESTQPTSAELLQGVNLAITLRPQSLATALEENQHVLVAEGLQRGNTEEQVLQGLNLAIDFLNKQRATHLQVRFEDQEMVWELSGGWD
ncbi:MAG: hypothetical protein KatS3mg113_0619 [Planctomycetaceae bacterium]|nr:MAG: hypothetical protein KatS3mg113_0619 [Planctomycetaceae bacterium]